MKSFIIGVIVATITTIILVVFYDLNMVMKFTGGIGIISWLLSALLSGSLNSGDRMRANFNTEDQEDRGTRLKITGQLLLFGLPNLCTAVIIFFAKWIKFPWVNLDTPIFKILYGIKSF